MDYRIEKTKNSIRSAFIELRSKKAIEKVTVKELCEKAHINKSTFYSHYRDVYDLSDHIESHIVGDIIKSLEKTQDVFENPKEFTRGLFIAYYSQSAIISTIFSGSRSERLPEKIEAELEKTLLQKYKKCKNNINFVLLTYTVYGSYYAYCKHMNSDLDNIIEQISTMSELLIKTLTNGNP